MTNSTSPPRRAGLAVLVLGIAATGIGVASASAAHTQQVPQITCSRANPGIVVGDSAVDAINYLSPQPLRAAMGGGSRAVVDGSVSRQFSQGVSLIKGYLAKNPKACAVVVSLGTNGPVRPSQWSSLMGALAKVPRVVVVNTYTKNYRREQPWMNQINADIQKLPTKYRNVRVANWAAVASTLSSTELPDGVHPDTPGAANKFTGMVVTALRSR